MDMTRRALSGGQTVRNFSGPATSGPILLNTFVVRSNETTACRLQRCSGSMFAAPTLFVQHVLSWRYYAAPYPYAAMSESRQLTWYAGNAIPRQLTWHTGNYVRPNLVWSVSGPWRIFADGWISAQDHDLDVSLSPTSLTLSSLFRHAA